MRLASKHPIVVGDIVFELHCNDVGTVARIDVEVSVPDPSDWPDIQRSTDEGVALDIKGTTPRLPEIEASLRVVEGLLSLYGLESIDTEMLGQEWKPESAEERQRLNVFGLRRRLERPSAEMYPPIPFDLVALSFLAVPRAHATYPSLSFFRRGLNAFNARRYMEAVNEFYYMIETLYAKGESKSHAVKRNFKSATDLRAAIQQVLDDPRVWVSIEPDPDAATRRFRGRYHSHDIDKVIEEIVKLRGFLHHHNQQRPGIWRPDDHRRYELEAMLLAAIAGQIAGGLARDPLFARETRAEYHRQFPSKS